MKKVFLSLALVAAMSVSFVSCKEKAEEGTEVEAPVTEEAPVEEPVMEEAPVTEEAPATEEGATTEEAPAAPAQ
ncbi:MAG: hypothetical protein ACOVLC_10055 [Flavobacterium sp.]